MAQEQNNKWNVPIAGLNKDSAALDNTVYSHLMNGNFETLEGGTYALTNEMSNILSSKFKAGFKVIGFKNDIITASVYFFLVNPTTNVGEFGVIKDVQNVVDLRDIASDCPDCESYYEMAEKLENTAPEDLIESQTYTTLLTDACNWNINGEPLNENVFNFSINHPIRSIVIKNEKCGKVVYFTDNYNGSRNINLSDLLYYQTTGVNVCGNDNSTPICLNADKLLTFRKFNSPELKPDSLVLGGNLLLGVYSFLIAYCESNGQEVSEYYSLTTPIPIFDENNNILAQEDLATRTNFGIKLNVSGLDLRFSYYKIVVAQTASLDGATRYFEEGVHTIDDNYVTYTSELNKNEISIDVISKIHLNVEKVEGLTTSNNMLFQYGITNKKDINLQPFVNLMGGFLQWQTHLASENLYEDGVNTSKFLGYNRDETVPFGIKFFINGGYETKVFPFIARPAFTPEEGSDEPGDKDVLVGVDGNPVVEEEGNIDILSILKRGDCVGVNRTERWQFYNTASVDDGFCSGSDVESETVANNEEVVCYVNNVATIEGNSLTIDLDENYIDFETYIEANKTNCDAFSLVSRYKIVGTIPLSTANVIVGGATHLMTFATDIPTTLTNFVSSYASSVFLNTGSVLTHTVERSITLSGTSGTANIVVGGVNYLTSFATNLTTTASTFVTDYAAAILLATGATVTSVGGTITISDYSNSFPTLSIVNVSDSLNGVVGAIIGDTLVFSNPTPTVVINTLTGDLGADNLFCEVLQASYPQHCIGLKALTFSGVGTADDEIVLDSTTYEFVWNTDIETTIADFVTLVTDPLNVSPPLEVSASGKTLRINCIVNKISFNLGVNSTLSYTDTGLFSGNCSSIVRDESKSDVEISNIILAENAERYIEKSFSEDYSKVMPAKTCTIYSINQEGKYIRDSLLIGAGMLYYPLGYYPTSADNDAIVTLYKRDSSFSNEDVSFAGDIIKIQSPSDIYNLYFNNYYIHHNGNELASNTSPDLDDIQSINGNNGYEYGYVNLIQGYTSYLDIESYATSASFPALPPLNYADIIYLDISTLKKYKYNGLSYVEITNSKIKDLSTSVDLTEGFYEGLHKGALWFKGLTENRDKFVIEVAKEKDANGSDNANANSTSLVRVSLFDKKTSITPITSFLVDLFEGELFRVEKSVTNTILIIRSSDPLSVIDTGTNWFTQNSYYITVENKIVSRLIDIDSLGFIDGTTHNKKWRWIWMVSPTDGCYGVVSRDVEYKQIEITWESISLRKKNTYTSECTYQQPLLKNCTAIPYKKGDFAYTESEQTYPNNSGTFNSSLLDMAGVEELFEVDDFTKLKELYLNEDLTFKVDDSYKPLADFTCRPIRHFRFPDNKVAPFMQNTDAKPFANSIIFPLGITIKESIIHAFLDLAVANNYITAEDRNNISKYEILRGDLNTDRSIIASGLLYDMREYVEKDKKVLYSNYPFNSYSADKLNSNLGEGVNEKFGEEGSNFTFHSPETDYFKAGLPSELSVQGYMYGNSKGHFEEVRNHPKWVILSAQAKTLAGILAGLEVAVQIAVNAASYSEVYRLQVGFSNSVNPVGIGLAIVSSIIQAANSLITDYGRLRYEWLKIFRDLGTPRNFANYYYAEGHYNYFLNEQEVGQQLRNMQVVKYAKSTRQQTTNEYTGDILTINNTDREKSVLVSLGSFKTEADVQVSCNIKYPTGYKNYDRVESTSSLTFLGENGGIVDENNGKSAEIVKRIASPYVAFKNYLPSQHGTINTVRWITTGYRGDLNSGIVKTCLPIFGGDTYIGRHTLKRKIPLFLTTAMGTASMTPFNYYYYNNIGTNPRFYCSYELNRDFGNGGYLFPDIDSDYNFDTQRQKGNYIIPPSKFYLYYYGVPSFLTESRINTNFRYGQAPYEKQFFPQVGDLGDWTQESKVSIKEPNHFFYNNVYSSGTFYSSLVKYHSVKNRSLAIDYNKEFNDCTTDFPNGVIYSLPDTSENSKTDPWLIYRPSDFYEFPAFNGKLKNLQSIESGALLARFENTSVIYNKVDNTVDDGRRPEAVYLGGSSVFARRPVSSSETDIGFGGTQSNQSVSTEFGHFHVDSMRGQVMFLPSGGGALQEISAILQGKTTYMRHWFKSHLPFKILKSGIEGIDKLDTDNGINGVGIVLGWDSRFRRLFITKKDYIPRPMPVGTEIVYHDSNFYARVEEVETVISLHNNTYFEEVSFTIAYSPVEQKWIGYYDFKPNYYIAHQNYFQTGINDSSDSNEFGLWSHILTNKSYQVFYGKFYPFTIEYQMRRSAATIAVQTLTWDVDVVRYHNEFDFSDIAQKGFNKLWVYGSIVNSGELWLDPNTGGIDLISSYPKTDKNGKYQRILVTSNMKKYSANYFYNRVQRHSTNTPIWYWDRNQIDKTLNKAVIKFSGKNVLEVLRSNMFSVRLSQDHESRLKYTFHLASSKDQEK